MFKKVLIAEDHQTTNISMQRTLQELGVRETKYVYYCDHALAWIRNAARDGQPYDLLVTDLYFEEDHNKQQIANGMELIRAARAIQPGLKVLVFSAEHRSHIIGELFGQYAIDAYVRKARHDAEHLKLALQTVFHDKTYRAPDLRKNILEKNTHEFTNVDLAIVSLLAQGVLQKDIPGHLQRQGLRPSSLSSVEKRLNAVKDVLEFTKNEQLIAYCKDIGVI